MNSSLNQTLTEAIEQSMKETELLKRLGHDKAQIVLEHVINGKISQGMFGFE